MKAPLWETSVGALEALLLNTSPTQLWMGEAYAITLVDGSTVGWSAADVAFNGDFFYSLGPKIDRAEIQSSVGVDVDELKITITCDVTQTLNGTPVLALIAGGGLDGATVRVSRVFSAGPGQPLVGAVLLFSGIVGQIDLSRNGAEVTLQSGLSLLSSQVPRNVYQPGCLNTLYDSACTIARAPLTVNGNAIGVTATPRSTFQSGLTQADGWFALGVMKFTSGANAGESRTVKSFVGGVLEVIYPWPVAVAVNDNFTIYPGCDKTLDTCTAKFNNRIHFRGFKFIPVAQTAAA